MENEVDEKVLGEARELLAAKDALVLATASEEGPYASLMAYASAGPDQVALVTPRDSRKYRNIRGDPRVSLLVDTRDRDFPDNREKARALTVTGEAREATGEERKRLVALLLKAHPHMKGFADSPDAAVLLARAESYLLVTGVEGTRFTRVPG